ncbi:hypothetical protein V5799_021707 [Amblyomma americanum]|uniref:CHHC U11-48K-type domain-containing protein n=1 Tax=Amblyomma americanum TaxID=6943 RepID=A0AAQ4FMJ6_AMBAM
METCPFSADHVVPASELQYHIFSCHVNKAAETCLAALEGDSPPHETSLSPPSNAAQEQEMPYEEIQNREAWNLTSLERKITTPCVPLVCANMPTVAPAERRLNYASLQSVVDEQATTDIIPRLERGARAARRPLQEMDADLNMPRQPSTEPKVFPGVQLAQKSVKFQDAVVEEQRHADDGTEDVPTNDNGAGEQLVAQFKPRILCGLRATMPQLQDIGARLIMPRQLSTGPKVLRKILQVHNAVQAKYAAVEDHSDADVGSDDPVEHSGASKLLTGDIRSCLPRGARDPMRGQQNTDAHSTILRESSTDSTAVDELLRALKAICAALGDNDAGDGSDEPMEGNRAGEQLTAGFRCLEQDGTQALMSQQQDTDAKVITPRRPSTGPKVVSEVLLVQKAVEDDADDVSDNIVEHNGGAEQLTADSKPCLPRCARGLMRERQHMDAQMIMPGQHCTPPKVCREALLDLKAQYTAVEDESDTDDRRDDPVEHIAAGEQLTAYFKHRSPRGAQATLRSREQMRAKMIVPRQPSTHRKVFSEVFRELEAQYTAVEDGTDADDGSDDPVEHIGAGKQRTAYFKPRPQLCAQAPMRRREHTEAHMITPRQPSTEPKVFREALLAPKTQYSAAEDESDADDGRDGPVEHTGAGEQLSTYFMPRPPRSAQAPMRRRGHTDAHMITPRQPSTESKVFHEALLALKTQYAAAEDESDADDGRDGPVEHTGAGEQLSTYFMPRPPRSAQAPMRRREHTEAHMITPRQPSTEPKVFREALLALKTQYSAAEDESDADDGRDGPVEHTGAGEQLSTYFMPRPPRSAQAPMRRREHTEAHMITPRQPSTEPKVFREALLALKTQYSAAEDESDADDGRDGPVEHTGAGEQLSTHFMPRPPRSAQAPMRRREHTEAHMITPRQPFTESKVFHEALLALKTQYAAAEDESDADDGRDGPVEHTGAGEQLSTYFMPRPPRSAQAPMRLREHTEAHMITPRQPSTESKVFREALVALKTQYAAAEDESDADDGRDGPVEHTGAGEQLSTYFMPRPPRSAQAPMRRREHTEAHMITPRQPFTESKVFHEALLALKTQYAAAEDESDADDGRDGPVEHTGAGEQLSTYFMPRPPRSAQAPMRRREHTEAHMITPRQPSTESKVFHEALLALKTQYAAAEDESDADDGRDGPVEHTGAGEQLSTYFMPRPPRSAQAPMRLREHTEAHMITPRQPSTESKVFREVLVPLKTQDAAAKDESDADNGRDDPVEHTEAGEQLIAYFKPRPPRCAQPPMRPREHMDAHMIMQRQPSSEPKVLREITMARKAPSGIHAVATDEVDLKEDRDHLVEQEQGKLNQMGVGRCCVRAPRAPDSHKKQENLRSRMHRLGVRRGCPPHCS